MQPKALALAALICTFSVIGWAVAQTPETTKAEGTTEADMIRRVEMLTRAVTLTEIPPDQPGQIDLGLLQVPGASPDLVQGVTAKAYARYVTVENKKIAQVVLVGVEKNGRQEPLNSSDFVAQFEVEASRIDPEKPVTIEGDQQQMIDALKRLAQEPAKVEEEQKQVVENQEKSASDPGSNATRNEQAAAYQNPEGLQLPPEPTEGTRITTEGCPIRIDVAGLRAIQQSRTQTTVNGTITEESGCTDGPDGFTLQRSYAVCTDAIDMDARSATAQFVLFYVDAGGARQEVSECAPDPEMVFPIVEKASACTISLDYGNGEAVPQAALVYTDANNAEVQVRGCQASEVKAAVAMARTTNGCSIRHDFTGGNSYQQATWTYQMDGISYQAGGCSDTGVKYAHTKIYEDAGQYICSPIVNLDAGTVTLASRLQINVDGVRQYINDCTPDATGSLPVVATTDGCTNPANWEHDLTAGQSYGSERYYYVRSNGNREYVTTCQNSTDVYAHQVETTGWQNHDDQMFAYPLTTVYITPPSGRYDIKTSEVLQGAVQQPYVLTGTSSVWNGQSEYAGCDALRLTDLVQVWRRPDGTEYNKKIGTGEPQGPVNVCVNSVIASQQRGTGSAGSASCSSVPGGTVACGESAFSWSQTSTSYSQTVNKVEIKNIETGQVIGTTCQFADSNNNGNYEDDWNLGLTSSSTSGGTACTCYGSSWPATQSLWVGQSAVARGQPACPF